MHSYKKYDRKRRLDCEQQGKFFQPFEISDIVWVKNRGAPADGLKKKHMLGHNGPFRVIGVQGFLSHTVVNVTTRKKYRVHFLHMSMASNHQFRRYATKSQLQRQSSQQQAIGNNKDRGKQTPQQAEPGNTQRRRQRIHYRRLHLRGREEVEEGGCHNNTD
jgi:hypothetical protein